VEDEELKLLKKIKNAVVVRISETFLI